MFSLTVRIVTALAALTVVVSAAPAVAATPSRDRQLQQGLDQLVAAGAPGALLLDRHGSHTVRLTSGVADLTTGRPALITDRFRAASQMKSYTATIVLQLVQERRFGLDDEVDALIPGVIPHGYGRGVTVRHLLQHTSGLFNFNDDPRVLGAYLGGDLGHVWTPQQLLDIAFEHPPLFPPGTAVSYSDTGYFLAAYVVEAVTGHRFGAELRARILRPLGLRGTNLPRTTAIRGSPLHGYFPLGDPPVPTDLTYMYPWSWAAGGLTSTVDDSARFYRALLGGRLIGPALMREMMTTLPDPGSDLPTGSGLGVQRWTPCGDAWGHSGNAGGYLVYTWISADTRHETVLAINGDPQLLGPAGMQVYQDLLARTFCRR